MRYNISFHRSQLVDCYNNWLQTQLEVLKAAPTAERLLDFLNKLSLSIEETKKEGARLPESILKSQVEALEKLERLICAVECTSELRIC